MPEPINEFFAVLFAGKNDATAFSLLALKACDTQPGMTMNSGERRPVVFQTLMPGPGQRAFVSRGAAQLIRQISSVPIANTPIALADLPDGLALVIGDQRDVYDYERRRHA